MENTEILTTEGMPTENGGMPEQNIPKEKKQMMTRAQKRLIFYILMLIFPLANVAVFYVYVNFDMIRMSFFQYTEQGITIETTFVWFDNYKYVLDFVINRFSMVAMSMSFYFYSLICMPIAVIFSYYLYKGYPAALFFRVVLYMPSIFSGIVMILVYKAVLLNLFGVNLDLALSENLGYILFYNVWASFGMNIVMYTGAMCGINVSIPEPASLDGATAIQEFWFITIPMIFPTIRTFLVMGLVHFFTNSANLYTFYGGESKIIPMGYFMQVEKLAARLHLGGLQHPEEHMTLSHLSALGVVITAFTLPISLIVRRLLEKYGPSED